MPRPNTHRVKYHGVFASVTAASKPRGACAGGCRGCGGGRTRSRDLSKARAQLRLPRGQTPTDPPSAMGGAAQTDLWGRSQAVPRLRRPDEDDRHHHACRRGEGGAQRRRSAAEL
ncbi:MAG: hypothetical protein GY894_02085 [Planctomycetes bacterium]|nr:hypothetical protein [Planctomycetota bacterium]